MIIVFLVCHYAQVCEFRIIHFCFSGNSQNGSISLHSTGVHFYLQEGSWTNFSVACNSFVCDSWKSVHGFSVSTFWQHFWNSHSPIWSRQIWNWIAFNTRRKSVSIRCRCIRFNCRRPCCEQIFNASSSSANPRVSFPIQNLPEILTQLRINSLKISYKEADGSFSRFIPVHNQILSLFNDFSTQAILERFDSETTTVQEATPYLLLIVIPLCAVVIFAIFVADKWSFSFQARWDIVHLGIFVENTFEMNISHVTPNKEFLYNGPMFSSSCLVF